MEGIVPFFLFFHSINTVCWSNDGPIHFQSKTLFILSPYRKCPNSDVFFKQKASSKVVSGFNRNRLFLRIYFSSGELTALLISLFCYSKHESIALQFVSPSFSAFSCFSGYDLFFYEAESRIVSYFDSLESTSITETWSFLSSEHTLITGEFLFSLKSSFFIPHLNIFFILSRNIRVKSLYPPPLLLLFSFTISLEIIFFK